jgi:hypothetical protein
MGSVGSSRTAKIEKNADLLRNGKDRLSFARVLALLLSLTRYNEFPADREPGHVARLKLTSTTGSASF